MAKKTPKSPLLLRAHFSAAFGAYVMSSASNESVFRGFLTMVLRDDTDANIAIWYQFNSTRSRLELVRNTFRTLDPKGEDTIAVSDFIKRYRGLTRVRNFYAHAIYALDKDGSTRAHGFEITENDQPVKQKERVIDQSAINELVDLNRQLEELNTEMWEYLADMHRRLVASGEMKGPPITPPHTPHEG